MKVVDFMYSWDSQSVYMYVCHLTQLHLHAVFHFHKSYLSFSSRLAGYGAFVYGNAARNLVNFWPSLICDAARRRSLVDHRRFGGTSVRHTVQEWAVECLAPENGTDMFLRNVGNHLSTYLV
jgi:hypothetical protein